MAPQKPAAASTFFAGTGRFPADVIELSPRPLTAEQCTVLAAELARNGLHSTEPDVVPDEPYGYFFELISNAHRKLLEEARFFVPDPVELLDFRPEKPLLTIAVPRLLFQGTLATDLFLNLAKGFGRCAHEGKALDTWLGKLRGQLAERDRPSSNTVNFIDAASALGMPLTELPARHTQVGHGARAAVLKGSITHDTSSIGVALAKQKSVCKALLAQAGLPVAEGAMVANLEQARECAAQFGYPVVVKPADLDGGEAVSCDIRTDEELDQGFRLASAASPNVLVEKHIEGRDFRLLFYGDTPLKRIARFPGGVTGNGTDSVAQLVGRMNADPERHSGRDAIFYPLDFDEEAELMLRRRGIAADSVPADGEFVQLRRAANFSRGGHAELVTEEIHPDNLDLCRRAMHLMRLDLAGLDLILPDITRSWREAGGVICEVNAQPFIGASISRNSYSEILQELVPGGGRIPLVLAVGELTPATLDALVARIPQLAVIDAQGARIDGHPLTVSGMPWLKACQAALLHPQTAAALCVLDPGSGFPKFSPVGRFSAAYLLDGALSAGDGEVPPHLAAMLARAGGNVAAPAEYRPALERAGLAYRMIDPAVLVEELVRALG